MDSIGNLAETKFAKTIPHFSCFRLRFRLIWPALLVEMHLLPAESCGISGISSRFPIVRLPCSPFGFPTRARAFPFGLPFGAHFDHFSPLGSDTNRWIRIPTEECDLCLNFKDSYLFEPEPRINGGRQEGELPRQSQLIFVCQRIEVFHSICSPSWSLPKPNQKPGPVNCDRKTKPGWQVPPPPPLEPPEPLEL